MQTATWLRIAAGLTAFQAAGHTFGAVLAGASNAEEGSDFGCDDLKRRTANP